MDQKAKPMRLTTFIFAAIFLLGLKAESTTAEELVMKTGERFSSDQVWEENGKIRFNLQGLIVSVDKDEVTAVIRNEMAGQQDIQPDVPQPGPMDREKRETGSRSDSSEHALDREHRQRWRVQNRSSDTDTSGRSAYPVRSERGTGLQNITWKMTPEAIGGLVKIKTEEIFGGIDHYAFPEQTLKWGDALLDGVSYGFWRNQLYSVMMWADGRIGYQRLRDELFLRFGPGSRNRPEIERFIWLEEKTQRMLEFDVDLNMGIFVMRSSELDAQIKRNYPN